MQTLKIILATLVVSAATVALAAAGLIYSGAYNVAATSKHWSVTHWILQKTVHRSVDAQASGIAAPQLGGRDQLLAGAASFDAMCSRCHAPPGAQPSVAAQGMYPAPPELTHAAREKSPAKIFWVIKHGIKASGMPAWGASHSDDALWAMTAFIEQLPDMTPAHYRQMLQTAEARGIGHGHGAGPHHDEPGESHDGGHHAEGGNGREHDSGEHKPEQSDSPDPQAHAEDSAHAHS